MRVAYFVAIYPVRSERFIYREIEALGRAGVDVSLLALRRGTPAPDLPDIANVCYRPPVFSGRTLRGILHAVCRHPLRCLSAVLRMLAAGAYRTPHLLTAVRNIPTALWFASIISRDPPDHLHAHFANIPGTLAMTVSHITGIPFSFSAHAWDVYAYRGNLAPLLRKATFALTCTRHAREQLLVRYGTALVSKVHLVYHGIPADFGGGARHAVRSLPNYSGRHFAILSAGRLVAKKGFPDLVRACRLLKEKGVPFRCEIVGSGPSEPAIRSLVRDLDLEGEVVMFSEEALPGLIERYVQSDIFALASRTTETGDSDGLPNVLVEAMSMGLPIVTTDAGGISELIHHGYNGLLVPPGNPAELAKAIVRLAGDDTLREAISRHGRQTVKLYLDVDESARALKRLFESTSHGGTS